MTNKPELPVSQVHPPRRESATQGAGDRMTDRVEAALAYYHSIFPLYEGQEPRHDEVIVAELERRGVIIKEFAAIGKCPVNAGTTIAECQQCGCSLGLWLDEMK